MSGSDGPTQLCACHCGQTLPQFDAQGRERKFIPGHHIKKAIKYGMAFLERMEDAPRMTDEELGRFARRVLSL